MYYKVISDDLDFADRWFLGEPASAASTTIDARLFTDARVYHGPLPADLPIKQHGRPVQFLLAAFDMPVVSTRVADIVEQHAPGEIQRFPVTLDGRVRGYEILNVLTAVACVDETRTKIERWKPEDDRPDKVGQYRAIYNLTVDPLRAAGRHIFRLAEWDIALIVSDTLRRALLVVPDLGIDFKRVTPIAS